MKRILIIGGDSFIAGQFIKKYVSTDSITCYSRRPTGYEKEIVVKAFRDMPVEAFSGFDAVINFAAIVHRPELKDQELYDDVNYRMACLLAQKAKQAGVRQFVQMSTIAVFGSASRISETTPERPQTYYGSSKLKADKELVAMNDREFKAAIIRPPMAYGGGMAPGNMLRLIRLVNKHIPLPFGSARNSRDFINVKNLVEFIHLAVEKEVEGVFYPTDKVPYSTRNVVEEISRQLGVHTINLPSPSIFLKLIEKVRPDLYQKLWGDVVIDRQLALSAIGYEDVPNARSSHHTITLRGGGVIFYLGVLVHGLIFDFFAPWFLCGVTLVALVSFIDDMHPLSAKVRLLFQTFSLLLLLLQLGVHEVSWGYVVVALFVGLAILNIYNFMDGINGITGGYSLVAMLALWGINAFVFPIAPAGFIPVVILSLLVFNFYNFRSHAKCFSGDVGAISMAFIILFLLGGFIIHTGHVSALVFLAVYGVDGVLTIIHRILLKENIGQPHRKHLYQLLANEGKFAHLPVSLIYMGVQAVVNLGYLLVLVYTPGYTLIYFIISIVVLVVVYLPLRRKFYALREQI